MDSTRARIQDPFGSPGILTATHTFWRSFGLCHRILLLHLFVTVARLVALGSFVDESNV